MLIEPPKEDELLALADAYRNSHRADVCLGVAIQPAGDHQDVLLVLITPLDKQQFTRHYGGPPEYAPVWAINQSLDLIRRIPYDT